MKMMISLVFTLSLAQAEIWEKPPYQPDEGHLPESEQEKQEVREDFMDEKEKGELKRHQIDRPKKSHYDRDRSLRKPSANQD